MKGFSRFVFGFVVVIAALGARTAVAQDLAFHSLSVNDGLSQSHVSVIAQDQQGFMWFGTAGGGLNRFDGYQFEVFRHDGRGPRSLSSNIVLALHSDAAGVIWVGTNNGLNRFERKTKTFSRFVHDPADPASIGPGSVNCVVSGSDGSIWVASNELLDLGDGRGVVSRLDPGTGLFDRFMVSDYPNSVVEVIFVDREGTVWLGVAHFERGKASSSHGLYQFDPSTRTFNKLQLFSTPAEQNLGVTAIGEDHHGDLWLGTWGGGVVRFDKKTNSTTRFDFDPGNSNSLAGSFLRDLLMGPEEQIWALTWVGPADMPGGNVPGYLNLIDAETGMVQRFGKNPGKPRALGEFHLLSLFVDRFGTIWVGTSGAGLRRADTASTGFSLFRHNPASPDSLSSDFVRSILPEAPERLWVGTDRGLDLVNRRSGSVQHWTHDPSDPYSLGPSTVEAIHRDQTGRLWIGTLGGLFLFDEASGYFTGYLHDPDDPTSLSDHFVTVIAETRDGDLWVGTYNGGLNRLDPETGVFQRFAVGQDDPWKLPGRRVSAVRETVDGRLWVATNEGLAYLDRKSGDFKRVAHDPGDAGGLSSLALTCLHLEDEEPKVLWVGTWDGGLNRIDLANLEVTTYDLRDFGVLDNSVYSILSGNDGALWMSTNHGILRFEPVAGLFQLFGSNRGIQASEFNHRAAARGPGGELFFGGVSGLNAFSPQAIAENHNPPAVVITKVGAAGRDGFEHRLLNPTGTPATKVDLDFDHCNLVFEFVALHFTDPGTNTLAHRLEGFEDSWHENRGRGQATYTNLESGRYTFRVRAANAHGVWTDSEASFSFTIRPPLWATWWFQLLLGVAVLLLLAGAYRWRVGALRRREQVLEGRVYKRTKELEAALTTISAQAERLSELDVAKSRFFANVSHEFRTPLTLTIGPLEDLREGFHGPLPREAVDEIDIAIRNARRLLRLVNQLLETAKLEAGQLRLQVSTFDLVPFVSDILQAFSPLAERRSISVATEAPDEAVPIWADTDKMEQVFTNLLSNAFRFTPQGGAVRLRISENIEDRFVSVEIRDSGPGIPANLLPHIFDRFFQVDGSGTDPNLSSGIGLALTKELLELHDASIEVSSEEGFGSRFEVRVKTGRGHFNEGDIVAESERGSAHTGRVALVVDELASRRGDEDAAEALGGSSSDFSDEDATTVLIVDDNDDIRAFVRKHLQRDYRVLDACDGLEGLEIARSELPDLLISDVMMPRMDGIELCQAVKCDSALEFIPVVLLTAKVSIEGRLEGLGVGADDYLTKPFESRELIARVANLIASRRRLKEISSTSSSGRILRPHDVAVDSKKDLFLERVKAAIEENLEDDTFGVEQLAWELSMSRVHLYRRLREILDQTPSEVIVGLRLDRAAQLLTTDAGNVAEIAYGVGFKSVSHFSRRFRERFGKPPSVFRDSEGAGH